MNNTISNVNIENLNVYNNTTSIQSKVCTKCNQNKPLTHYIKDKRKLDGLQSSCKSCQLIVTKHWHEYNYQMNVNKIYNENDVKICSTCKFSKSITEYQKDKSQSDGLG